MASQCIALDHMIGWQGEENVCCSIMNLCYPNVSHNPTRYAHVVLLFFYLFSRGGSNTMNNTER